MQRVALVEQISMRFDIITLFPGMFAGPFQESIIARAVERGLLEIHLHNLRDYGIGKHQMVDDYPFGGGPGMVMKPDPIFSAVEAVRHEDSWVVLMTPQGRRFSQTIAQDLALRGHLILICGHYEGVDERVRQHLVDDELSIGDYVLTGGELPAMIVCDAVARLIPEVLGEEKSAQEESFSAGLLEYPQYTRPATFREMEVPEVLLSEAMRWSNAGETSSAAAHFSVVQRC